MLGVGEEEAKKAGLWVLHLYSARQLGFAGFRYWLSVGDFIWWWWWWWWKISAVTERLKSIV